jgi:hypothetical protein
VQRVCCWTWLTLARRGWELVDRLVASFGMMFALVDSTPVDSKLVEVDFEKRIQLGRDKQWLVGH